MGIRSFIQLKKLQKKWLSINKHNDTVPGNVFNIDCVSVGRKTYGYINIINHSDARLKIGNFCSIAPEVYFLPGSDHPLDCVSTFPFKAHILHQGNEATSKGDIIVQDDVWIGFRATVLSGVTIGQGAVIAAGAVVTSDVPPYAVVGGVPAKLIKYRFEPKLIESLLKIDYNRLSDDMIKEHICSLYEKLKDESQIEWLTKKEEILGK